MCKVKSKVKIVGGWPKYDAILAIRQGMKMQQRHGTSYNKIPATKHLHNDVRMHYSARNLRLFLEGKEGTTIFMLHPANLHEIRSIRIVEFHPKFLVNKSRFQLNSLLNFHTFLVYFLTHVEECIHL